MKVLIACEYSGIVREAFTEQGFDATSCDLLDTEIEGKHYKGDVLDILNDGWDMMIGFPPCTYISWAATSYWDRPGRIEKRLEALEFFRKLWEAPIHHICLENPLGLASKVITKHHQIIEPYYFGDKFKKRTCLWLKNLPTLKHSEHATLFDNKTHTLKPEPIYVDKSGKKRHTTDSIGHSSKQGHKRSKFWPGIAKAMAEQWGEFIYSNTA